MRTVTGHDFSRAARTLKMREMGLQPHQIADEPRIGSTGGSGGLQPPEERPPIQFGFSHGPLLRGADLTLSSVWGASLLAPKELSKGETWGFSP